MTVSFSFSQQTDRVRSSLLKPTNRTECPICMNEEGQWPTEREKLNQIYTCSIIHLSVQNATKMGLPGLKLILEQL